MTSRFSGRSSFLIVSLIVLILVISMTCGQAKSLSKRANDDYFFPETVDEEEAKKLIAEQKAKEKELADQKALQETTEKPPEFFKLEETDFSQFFNKDMASEMLKKFQKEQMEKQKSKNKSDINHQLWSIITLALFFGTGITVGILIVLVRGRRFQKSKNSLIEKKNQKNGNGPVEKLKPKKIKESKTKSVADEKNNDEQTELKAYIVDESKDNRIVI